MKKPVKIIIAVVLALAVLITGLSLFFPDVMNNLASGTFGKADKYRNPQMTEQDVQLRSDLTSNEDSLRSMITGLIYFSIFTEDLCDKIDSCTNAMMKQEMPEGQDWSRDIQALQDFSAFIRNNNKTLSNTISMLTGFLMKVESDQSADVERNLRDFQNYVGNLLEKDSILEVSLRSMDNFMLTNKTLLARKTEMNNLKAIRDQLLIGSVQLSGVLQDKQLAAGLCSYAVNSQEKFNAVCAVEKVGVIASQEAVNAIRNADKLQDFVVNSSLTVGSVEQVKSIILCSAQNLNNTVNDREPLSNGIVVGSTLVYSAENLQFVVCSHDELCKQVSAAGELNLSDVPKLGSLYAVASFSAVGLNVICSNYDIKNAYQSTELASVLNSASLGVILSNEVVGSVSYGSNFTGFVGQLNSQIIGPQ